MAVVNWTEYFVFVLCFLNRYRKLSRIFLENFKNSVLTVFVPLTIMENICFYPTFINFILFRQMAYQLIWVANITTWTLRGKLEVGVKESVLSLFKRTANQWMIWDAVQTFKIVSYCLVLDVELIKELAIFLSLS